MKVINIKKVIVTLTISTLFVAAIVYTFSFFYDNKTNHQTKESSKLIKSDQFFTRLPVDSLEQLTSKCDLIIVGEVISEGTVREIVVGTENGIEITAEEAKKLKEKSEKAVLSFPVTDNKIRISKTLYGNIKTEEIVFTQLGGISPEVGQTKVKYGDKVLLLLVKDDVHDNYTSVDLEHGCFTVTDGIVMSLSNYTAIAKYDNKEVQVLEDDILDLVKRRN